MFKLSFAKSLFSSSKRTKNGRAKKRVSAASASAKKRSLMSETAMMKDPFALNPPSSPAEEVKPSPLIKLAYQECTCASPCLCSPSPPPSSSSTTTTTKIKRIPPPPIHAPPLPPPSSPLTLASSASFSTPPVSVSLSSSFLSPSPGSAVSTTRRPTTATGGSTTPTARRPLPRPPSAGSPSLSASTPPGSPPLPAIRSAGVGGGGGGALRLPYGPNTTTSTSATPTNNATRSSPKLPTAGGGTLENTGGYERELEPTTTLSPERLTTGLTRKPTPVNLSRSATTSRTHSKHNRDRSLSQTQMHSSTTLPPSAFTSSTSPQKFHRATLSPPPPIPLPSPPPSPPALPARKRSVAGMHSRSDSRSNSQRQVVPAPSLPPPNTTHHTAVGVGVGGGGGGGRTSLISGARPNPTRQSTSSGPSTNTNTCTTNSELPTTVFHIQPLRRPSVASDTTTATVPPSPPSLPQVQLTRQNTMTTTTVRGDEGTGTPSVRVSVRPLPRVPSTCSTIMVAGSVPAYS